jgi:hypothetical protein
MPYAALVNRGPLLSRRIGLSEPAQAISEHTVTGPRLGSATSISGGAIVPTP